jgi:hypothetical protein
MVEQETTTEVAKKETVKQSIILVFTVASAAIMVYVMTPDAFRTTKMALALQTKRFAQKRVDYWQGIADKAATWYNRERM